jgi:hypothetical protein
MLKTAITGLEPPKRWSADINKIPSASAAMFLLKDSKKSRKIEVNHHG